jgi:hypothetical protein
VAKVYQQVNMCNLNATKVNTDTHGRRIKAIRNLKSKSAELIFMLERHAGTGD